MEEVEEELGAGNRSSAEPSAGEPETASRASPRFGRQSGRAPTGSRWQHVDEVPRAETTPEKPDVVVTGEGGMDSQTLNGKLPAVVAQRSIPRPVYAVVGRSQVTEQEQARLGVRGIHALASMTTADPSTDPALSRALAASAGQRIGLELHAASHSTPGAR